MTQLNYRYLLQVTLETIAPLQIGSGVKGIKTDSLVVRDVNNLPFIPGTTLAGLIAHSVGTEKERLMGSQQEGSRLIVTEAKLLNKHGGVMDGLVDYSRLNDENKAFLNYYEQLPIRQHVRINHKGTAENTMLFSEEVVLKGSRFCFEMELLSDVDASSDVDMLLAAIQSPTFRIGSGSRSGYGEIKVVKCLRKNINLTIEHDRSMYLEKSSQLGSSWEGWQDVTGTLKQPSCVGWTCYRLNLRPEDFVLFGSGFGDSFGEADMTYVRENLIVWDDTQDTPVGMMVEQEKTILIPASSVKGALSHRTAFHYNRLTGKDSVGKSNAAVQAIFGSEREKDKQKAKCRGNILISDVIQLKAETTMPKILNHVSVDRFTGGAIDGALFTEQTLYAKGDSFNIDLMIANEAFPEDNKNIQTAFEAALHDITSGMLPLGGGVNRGNGIFVGKVTKYN